MNQAQRWEGRVRMGLGWGAFVGVAGDNAPHRHHAVQLLLSEQPQPLWTAVSGLQPVCGAVIGPALTHQLGSNGQPVQLLYVEPSSAAGRRLMAGQVDGLRLLTPEDCTAARRALDASESPLPGLVEVLAPAAEAGTGERVDPAIEAWIAALPPTLPEGLTAAHCARQLGLSSSRFQHRFRAHTGLPLRPYLRWRRLLDALRAVLQGASLTDAAHAAGFADAAHFTRTCRRHFGLAPRALSGMRPRP